MEDIEVVLRQGMLPAKPAETLSELLGSTYSMKRRT
jgi:hypothetical protein